MKDVSSMGKIIKYRLNNESLQRDLGTISFNGRFVFELDKNITTQQWNSIGFIPLEDKQHSTESSDLFAYLRSRLPINIREKSSTEILRYIDKSGLRVASDSFVLNRIS